MMSGILYYESNDRVRASFYDNDQQRDANSNIANASGANRMCPGYVTLTAIHNP